MKIIYFYSTVVCVIGFQKLLALQDIFFFNISPSTNSNKFLHPKPEYKISLKSSQAFGHYNNHTLTQMTTKFVFYPPVFKIFKNTDIKSIYGHFRVDLFISTNYMSSTWSLFSCHKQIRRTMN